MRIFSYILIVLLTMVVIYSSYSNTNLVQRFNGNLNKLNYYESYFTIHRKYTGHFIYNALEMKKDIYDYFLKRNAIKNNYILIKLDSIECMSCIKYHIENIQNLIKGKDIPVVIYSALYRDMIKKDIPTGIELQHPMVSNPDFPSNKMAVFYINEDGRIIYFDVSNKQYYEISRQFYKGLERMIDAKDVND